MSWIDGVRERARQLLRAGAVERESEEELSFHIARETENNVARGMDPDAAHRAALLSFGGRDRFGEAVRDEWGAGAVRGVWQDVRRAWRRLAKRPGFAVAAWSTLALGIGVNAAMFSLVRGVLMDPLPYRAPESLVVIWNPSGALTDDTWTSQREIVEYAAATTSFESLGGYTTFNANLVDGEPERVRAGAATASLFEALGVPAFHGRIYGEAEDSPGQADVVVLGHELWQRRFGGARDVIGTTIRVNGVPRTVLGVMPPDFRLPLDYRHERPTELWVPVAIDRASDLSWGDRSYFIVARLRAGVTATQANADIERATRGWQGAGFIGPGYARTAFPVNTLLFGAVRPALWILFAAVAAVLLIACANVAHLLLAQADARRREIATQAALGASRFRIVRQLLVESGLLAFVGAVLGLGIAYVVLRAAMAATPVAVIRARGVELDPAVLAYTALLAIATTVLAGLAPALGLSRVSAARAMSGARGDAAALRRRTRRALIILETSLSLVLVLSAGLLARSFAHLREIDLGFDPSHVLALRIDLPAADYNEPGQAETFHRELIERVAQLPGVTSAGAARLLPLAGTIGNWTLTIEDRTPEPGENFPADWQIVTPGYFETMRVQLVEGRFVTAADHADAPLVAVINETMAQRYWPGESAIGKRFHLGTADQPWIQVVGITRDIRHNTVLENARTEMFIPHAQWGTARADGRPQYGMSLVVRTAGAPLALLPAVRELVRALDPSLPIADARTMQDITTAALAQPRFTTLLLGGFGALALLLAAIGLYGVLAFIAARRAHEIGVRMALGARAPAVARMVMAEGVGTAAIGIMLGLLGSFWMTRFLAGQLYGIEHLDPLTFLLVPPFLLAVAALASWLPARRAARVSPLTALRLE